MSHTRLLVLQALSPVHCGTGHAVSGIDLPIAREKPTGVPIVPGSSLKGVLRAAGSDDDDKHLAVFGPVTKNASEYGGSVQFGDVTLAFLPMRSLRGTFAYVTSPYLLRRLMRSLTEAGLAKVPAVPGGPKPEEALVTGTVLTGGNSAKVVFEDFDFTPQIKAEWKTFAEFFAKHLPGGEGEFFVDRACVVHDDVMGVLLQTATEVTQRIKLDPNTKTVEDGALWSEEALPVETLLVGLVAATPVTRPRGPAVTVDSLYAHLDTLVSQGVIQVGGNATVGRGMCRIKLVKGA
jgi:CRISPR-associated protein Cmr4